MELSVSERGKFGRSTPIDPLVTWIMPVIFGFAKAINAKDGVKNEAAQTGAASFDDGVS
jgi:hypothetical protein